MTLDEELDQMEQRARGSQKARAHVVTLDRCPCCGTRLGARDVAAIKRGEQQCPNRPRQADRPSYGLLQVVSDAMLAALVESVAADDPSRGAA